MAAHPGPMVNPSKTKNRQTMRFRSNAIALLAALGGWMGLTTPSPVGIPELPSPGQPWPKGRTPERSYKPREKHRSMKRAVQNCLRYDRSNLAFRSRAARKAGKR